MQIEEIEQNNDILVVNSVMFENKQIYRFFSSLLYFGGLLLYHSNWQAKRKGNNKQIATINNKYRPSNNV